MNIKIISLNNKLSMYSVFLSSYTTTHVTTFLSEALKVVHDQIHSSHGLVLNSKQELLKIIVERDRDNRN